MSKHKDIVFTQLPDGEGVLLNLKTKKFYTLNSTGAEIWKHYELGKTTKEIASALHEEYEVELDEAEKSVQDFFQELRKYNIIE